MRERKEHTIKIHNFHLLSHLIFLIGWLFWSCNQIKIRHGFWFLEKERFDIVMIWDSSRLYHLTSSIYHVICITINHLISPTISYLVKEVNLNKLISIYQSNIKANKQHGKMVDEMVDEMVTWWMVRWLMVNELW